MKKIIGIGLISLAPSFAFAAPLWPQAIDLVRQCARQTVCVRHDGTRVAQALTSACPELVVDGLQARFIVGGKTYLATISESAESDGGDLNDLTLQELGGKSTERHETILGFNDVLLTLLGGNTQTIQTIYGKCTGH